MLRTFIIRFILLLGILSCSNAFVFAQKDPVIVLNFNAIETGGKKLAGVEMKVYKGASVVASASSANTGKFSKTTVPFNEVYRVEFSKSGYVTKTIEIDAKKGYVREDIERLENYIDAPIELFQEQPSIDYSIITATPVGRLRIEPTNGQLALDAAYTSKRSKEIEKFLADLNNKKDELDKQFLELVKEGDKNFSSTKYEEALIKYKEAQKIKPADANVQQKITDTQIKIDEIAKQKAIDENFNKLIQSGDQLLASNKFDEAIAEYQKAQTVKPNDKLPPQKIKEANDKKNASLNAEKDKAYADKMKQAKEVFDDKDYAYAKTLYKAASDIKPIEKEPKDKIIEIDKLIAAQVEAEKKYNELMDKGDKALLAKNYDEAIKSFTDASALRSEEKRPKDQLELAQKLKNEADVANQKEKQYKDLIAAADKLLATKDYENAKAKYQEALDVKKNDIYSTGKIKDIDDILKKIAEDNAKQQQKEKQFQDLVTQANAFFEKSDWEQAKSKYKEAQQIKNDDKFVNDRIAEIEKKILAKQQEELAAKAKKEQYDALIKKADAEFQSVKYDLAKNSYTQALDLFADEKHPKDRLLEIDKKVAELASQKAQEEAEKEKRAQYESIIAKADAEFIAKKWDDSKSKYNEALKLYGNENHPKNRIAEIDTKLKEIAENEAKNEAEKAKRKQYDDLVLVADGFYNSSNWEESKQKYTQALEIYPSEKHPKDRITDINKKLEQIAANKEKEATEKAKREQFDKLMADGNSAVATQNYTQAITLYTQASNLISSEQTPKDKIAEVNKIIADNKAKQEAEEQLNSNFLKLVNEADALAAKKEWDKAREKYSAALSLKQDSPTRAKLDQVEKTISENQSVQQAEQAKRKQYEDLLSQAGNDFESQKWKDAREKFVKASAIYPNEQLPVQKIVEIDKFIEEEKANQANQQLLKQYQNKIAEANTARDKKEWDNAKALYKQANTIKPDEDYPQQQIDWINQQMQLASKEEADKAYQKIIEVADKKLADKEYNGAKELYNRASGLRSEDPYPKQKIAEIEKLIIEENNQKEKQKILEKYNDAIAKADAARDKKEWDNAKALYKQANTIKPDEDYPQQQIDWINQQMQLASKEEADKAYQKIIEVADKKLADKEYNGAKELYNRASGLRSEDPYPKQKIAEIEKLIIEENEKKTKDQVNQKYKEIIAQADASRDADNWDKAKELYKRAYDVKNDESYPQQQIDWINKRMKQLADENAEKQYQRLIQAADNNLAKDDLEEAKKLYSRALTFKPEDEYPKQKLREIEKRYIARAEEAKLNANRQKSNEGYLNHINKAKELESAEKYQQAISEYRNALGFKPEAPFPKQKIEELTVLLNQLAEEKRQKDEKDRMAKLSQNVNSKDGYGEEVFDLDADQLESLMKKSAVDNSNYWADKVEEYNDKKTEENIENNKVATEKLENRNEEFREIETNRIQQEINNDKPRENVVELVESYKEGKQNNERIQNENSTEKTQLSKEQLNQLEEKRLHLFDEANNTRKSNVDNMVVYNDNKSRKQEEIVKNQTTQTYAVQQGIEQLKQDRITSEIELDKPRNQITIDVERYKDEKIESQANLKNQNELATYKTHQAANELEEKIIKQFEQAENTRKRNVDEVEKYQNDKIKNDEKITMQSENKTYATHQFADELETKISKQFIEADNTRQENLVNVERYKDEKVQTSDKTRNDFTEKNQAVYNQLDAKNTERSNQFADADKTRQANEISVEKYKDLKTIEGEKNKKDYTEKNQAVYSQLDDKTERSRQFTEADKTRENNANDIADYKDQKAVNNTQTNKNFDNRNLNTQAQFENKQTENTKKQLAADKTREANADGMMHYNDVKAKQSTFKQEANSNKTVETYEAGEKLRTNINRENIAADKTRAENADNVDSYKDKKIEENKSMRKDKADKLIEQAELMDKIKNLDPQSLTEEYKNDIALAYGPGVTERKFQRKNARGEVIEITIERIVVVGNRGNIYKKVVTKHGAAYFKNNGVISESIWDTETNLVTVKK
ncbi:MAG: hypothetical protein ACK4K0_05100 [Flavobacteriales bacterium]